MGNKKLERGIKTSSYFALFSPRKSKFFVVRVMAQSLDGAVVLGNEVFLLSVPVHEGK